MLWSLRDRAGRTLPRGERIHSIAFSPDGRRLAVGHTDDSARLWDTSTRDPVGVVLQNRPDERLQVLVDVAVAFSADGTRVATASGRSYARVWDAASGAPLSPLFHHRYGVCHARFSPDSRRLVTSSLDGTARIWNVATGDGTPASADLLANVAELVGGVRLSEDGAIVTLESHDIQQRLEKVRGVSSSFREIQPLLSHLRAMRNRAT